MRAQNVEQATENRQQRMKGDDIARRLLVFGVHVLQLVRKLQRDSVGRHGGRQLLRSATAGGANYEESRSAESRADFPHKASIAACLWARSTISVRVLGCLFHISQEP